MLGAKCTRLAAGSLCAKSPQTAKSFTVQSNIVAVELRNCQTLCPHENCECASVTAEHSLSTEESCVQSAGRLNSLVMPERRKAPRYPLEVPGILHPAGARAGINVIVLEISTLGCSLDKAQDLSVGKKCELYIDWQGGQMGLEAQTVWIDACGKVGLKFLSVDKDTQRRLNEFCASVRTQPHSSARQGSDSAPRPAGPAGAPEPPHPAAPRASVTALPMKPAPKRERRKVPRYISELRARLTIPATGATTRIELVTLSILGGCVEGSDLPDVGQICELSAEWEGKEISIQGDAVWKGKRQAGIKFASLDASGEKLLRQICSNLRLKPMAPLPSEPE